MLDTFIYAGWTYQVIRDERGEPVNMQLKSGQDKRGAKLKHRLNALASFKHDQLEMLDLCDPMKQR